MQASAADVLTTVGEVRHRRGPQGKAGVAHYGVFIRALDLRSISHAIAIGSQQCSKKPTRFLARGTSNGRLRSTPSGLDSGWPLETKPIHRTTLGYNRTVC